MSRYCKFHFLPVEYMKYNILFNNVWPFIMKSMHMIHYDYVYLHVGIIIHTPSRKGPMEFISISLISGLGRYVYCCCGSPMTKLRRVIESVPGHRILHPWTFPTQVAGEWPKELDAEGGDYSHNSDTGIAKRTNITYLLNESYIWHCPITKSISYTSGNGA